MEKKSNSSIDEYKNYNDAFYVLPDVCDDDDVLRNHFDDDHHEFYEYYDVDDDDDDDDDDVDIDNIDYNDQNYQNKKRKLSAKGNRIKIDKLEILKQQAKFECKECNDEIQELQMVLNEMQNKKALKQESIRKFNVQINKLLK